jgi:hypothetical protein
MMLYPHMHTMDPIKPIPLSLPLVLEHSQRFHCSIFIHAYRILQQYSTPTLSFTSLPTGTHPTKTVPVLHACHSVLRTIFCR